MSTITLNTKAYIGTNSIVNGVAAFVERSLGIAKLFSEVRTSLRLTDKSRARVDLAVPFPQAEGAPVCCGPDEARLADAILNIRMHPSLTLAERTDFADRLKDLVSSAQFRALIISLEQQS